MANIKQNITPIVVGLLVVCAIAYGGYAFYGKKVDDNILRLGLVSPLTGPGAASGAVQANSAKMAVDEINAQGGIGGKIRIQLISEDDEGNPAKSVTVTQKLISQDNIHVMIGALNSSCTLADMKITEKAKIPQVAPSSTAQSVVEQGSKYIFRNAATDLTHVTTLYNYITKKLGKSTVAILHESSDFGAGARNILHDRAPDMGVEILLTEVYNSGEKDFSVQLTKIRDANPDVLILWGYYTEVALICKQVKQYGIDIPLMGSGYNSPKLVELGGDAIDGLILTTTFTSANPDPRVQAFDKKYRDLYKLSYDQNASQVYDSVYIIAEAVQRAGLDPQKIRDEIAATRDYPGLSGVTRFDERGEVIKEVLIIKFVDGQHTMVN